ncbi:hypothetical protein R1flu_014581 [Riccia fluitans]|uniref:Nonsense-mediated mRNA decay factor SMG8 n=1 Tax=Riccia fluitans TaxID=41844 RepID=A0ABD1YGV6_9MARC
MSVRMLSRPPSTNGNATNVGIQISVPPPASVINPTSSSPPSFPPSASSGSPPSPFSFPPPPELSFQQRTSLSSTSPLPAAGPSSCVLNFSPSVQTPSSSPSVSVSSSGSGTTCVPTSPLSSLGTSGVVVVGVIGRVEHEVSQLLDRLLDSQVFGIKNGGLESWTESEKTGVVLAVSGQNRENERDAAAQITSHLPSGKGPFEDGGTSEVERKVEDGSVAAPEFLDQKHEPRTRGLKNEKFQISLGDNSKQKERRINEKLVKGLGGNGSNERRKDSRWEEKTTGDDGTKVGEGMRDHCKSTSASFSKFKHYHDEEKGMVYVQFTWGSLPLDILREEARRSVIAGDDLSALLEQHEAEGMRGLLFMFSVCHIILLVHDGAHFDTRFLHILRMLQAAKHSLAPFIKAQVLPGLLPPPSSITRPSPLKPISLATNNASSGRTSVVGRNSSTIALMSGSTPVLFPGQCTPVVLFVFLEHLTEPSVAGTSCAIISRAEDASEVATSSVSQSGPLTQSLSANYMLRQSGQTKQPAGLTVVRSANKSEAGFRKKLQSSMEAQIRFLLKKCRTVAGSGESGPSAVGAGPGMGPRGPGGSASTFQGVGGGGALFVLDPSRAVVLLDRTSNHLTDALDSATDAMEAMLLGAEDTLEAGLNAGVTGEDIQTVRDFLWRQVDILRGKGGISSSAGGGSAGVGMVAAAAAAAAASAASGGSSGTSKPVCSPPELPTISSWLSACRLLAEALFVKIKEENGISTGQRASEGNRSVMKKGSVDVTRTVPNTGSLVRSKCTIDATISCLESGVNMDEKFSATWCKRVLPSAHEVYLKGLPPCYPTSLHKSQLEKALSVFRAMVRGPAVPVFAEKLRMDCEAVWHSGRRLCDAVSLTGKPCVHQVHEVSDSLPTCSSTARRKGKDELQETGKTTSEKRVSKPHSSGVVFLHACACGRSRKLRKDPFDFESANVRFFKFPNCEDLLPSLVLPCLEGSPSIGGSPWSLVCLGNSHYYQPTTGLLQSGFCSKQNFLSPWDIPVVYRKAELQEDILPPSPPKELITESLIFGSGKAAADRKVMVKSLLPRAESTVESKTAMVSLYSKVAEKGYLDTSRPNSTRVTGLPDTPRGFTEIATKTNYGGEAAFPPLPQKQDKPTPPPRTSKHLSSKERKEASQILREYRGGTSKPPVNEIADKMHDRADATAVLEEELESESNGKRQLMPKMTLNSVTEHVRVYIGFEHECPRGHRFLLSANHSEISVPSLPAVLPVAGRQELPISGRLLRNKNPDQYVATPVDSTQSSRPQDVLPLPRQQSERTTSGLTSFFTSKWGRKDIKIPDEMQYWSVQDGHGEGYSLLNSNLPIYMNCPYCKTSEDDNKVTTYRGMVLGGTISQLQRIFLVTPPLPILLATRPVVEFEDISKPVKTLMEFSPGSEVVLPPDSFLSLRLPFVYYTQMDGIPIKPLLVNQQKPEHTAWLVKGTALYVKSKDGVNGSDG